MNENDLRNISDDAYLRLMAEAYPGPKKDLHTAVMAQISAETELSPKKAKLLTPRRRNLAVKYGSIAACFVLLLTLGIRIVPMMKDMTADEAVAEDAAFTESIVTADTETAAAAADTAEPEENGGVKYKSTSTASDSAEKPAEEEVVPEEAEEAAAPPMLMAAPPASPVPEEAPEAEIEADTAAEEAPAEEIVTEEAAPEMLMSAGGFSGYYDTAPTLPKSFSCTPEDCPHADVFGNSWHDIPQTVVNLVLDYTDADTLAAWYRENDGTCGMNIYDLLHTFSVPRTAFETLITTTDLWYHHDYNADILYGSREEAEAYYQSGGSYTEYVGRCYEYRLKMALFTEVGMKPYHQWAAEHGYTAFRQWEIAEFTDNFGITDKRLAELRTNLDRTFAADYPDWEG